MSNMPTFSMRELLEAGVHYGHKTQRWDPRMAPYLFGIRNDIHIIDLQQTVPLLHRAMAAVRDVASRNGRILFVGTKRSAQESVAQAAESCGQYYVNHRWLGGMLTNWRTISQSIKRMRQLEETLADPAARYTKKERLQMERQKDKLERSLGGIREMGGVPDLIVVIDTNKESLAVEEAQKLSIPIIAILDSNSNPDNINYPIPGNDDSIRAIEMYCNLMSGAVIAGGGQASVKKQGDAANAPATDVAKEMVAAEEEAKQKIA